ncbi:MAG TPA: hypothetical protein ENG48_09290 [Candidatus Atribacteria bacterium]|nr:hypothetical protein [Candidatus Atribacteria bacterium]
MDILHRVNSNNSIIYFKKPTREQLEKQINNIRHTGEPGFINGETARKRKPDFEGTNPCLVGSTEILTPNGYKTIESLADLDTFEIIDIKGNISTSKAWYTGDKEVIDLKDSQGNTIITCTPDHKLMTADGKTIEAKDALNTKLMLYYKLQYEVIDTYVSKIESKGIQKVFDFTEPNYHWGIVNRGIIAHNCGEILLKSKQTCNLTSLNVMAFVEDKKLNYERLYEAMELISRANFRMTFIELEVQSWDRVRQNNRVSGVSLTGWQDMKAIMGISEEEEIKLLQNLKAHSKQAIENYAKDLNVAPPEHVTTVKPEGTQSLMPTVSPGVHYSFAPYYIRRVRISASDPLLKQVRQANWRVVPEVGQTEENANTFVVEFPVKSPTKTTAGSISAIQQLENYKKFMTHYVDHNASVTISVKDNEWDEVTDWIWNNWDSIVGITLLADNGGVYPLMPYEEISEEEYNLRVAEMKPLNLNKTIFSLFTDDFVDDAECSTGVCPVR